MAVGLFNEESSASTGGNYKYYCCLSLSTVLELTSRYGTSSSELGVTGCSIFPGCEESRLTSMGRGEFLRSLARREERLGLTILLSLAVFFLDIEELEFE